MPDAPLLILFVKYPEPGRVKTRLAADVGDEAAARIYRMMVASIIGNLPQGTAIRIVYHRFRSETDYREWLDDPVLAEAEYVPQCEGDLGERLTHAFAEAFQDGWEKVGVIGSDCVELTSRIYHDAWKELKKNDVVIGPTFDGGYYFLAMKNFQPALFANITWSTPIVFGQTLLAAKMAQLSVALLPKLHDIDTLEDWKCAKLV